MAEKVVSSGPVFFRRHSMPAGIDIFRSKASLGLDSFTHCF